MTPFKSLVRGGPLTPEIPPLPLYPLPPREGKDLKGCELQLFYNSSCRKTEPVIEV
jgi:hypothetical protein